MYAYVLVTRAGFLEAINILTVSTNYQGVDGYFCDNVFYCYHDKLSHSEDRYFFTTVLSFYSNPYGKKLGSFPTTTYRMHC